MRTRSSFNLPVESSPNPTTSNPKRCNRRRSKQPFILEESPLDAMADQRTIAELLRAPTEGYAEAIVQTSAVTTAMTAILKQFQATPPPAFVKAVEEICVTCGGAHPYYQCLAAGDNTFPELRDNIQGYVAAAAFNYNQVFFQMNTASPSSSGHLSSNTIANPKGELKAITTQSGIVLDGPFVPIPPPFINPEEDERLHINITLANALILIPKYQKMLKALLSNKEKRLEVANTPLNENCSAVNLKKLPEKLRDPGKFLIPCGFIGITRDVFVPVGKFTFSADFVIVDYESDPRVPLILRRPFLQTTRALIDVYGEEMILHDGDERLTLNIRYDTSSYSNQPQKESINMINIYDDSSEDFLENLFATNHQSGNPTFSSHPNLTSPDVKDDIFDPEGGNVPPEKLLDLDSTKDLHPLYNVNPLSGSTTSSSPNHLLEEFADELTLITIPPGNDDLPFDIDNLADLNDNLADTMPEMFTDEHALDYSSPPLYDEYDDDLFEVNSDTDYAYDDPFDSKG
nr:hypothetical protein [Tanacetum cinerariifolium]